MIIKVMQEGDGIALTTSGELTNKNRVINFLKRIPGQPEEAVSIKILANAEGTLDVTVLNPQEHYFVGTRIEVLVGGGVAPYQVFATSDDVRISQVPGTVDKFYIDIISVKSNTFTINVEDSEGNIGSTSLQITKSANMSVSSLPANGIIYNKEDIYYKVAGIRGEATCVPSVEGLIVSRVDFNSFRIFHQTDLQEDLIANITFSANGEEDVVKQLTVKPLVALQVSGAEVTGLVGEKLTVSVANIPFIEDVFISCSDENVTFDVTQGDSVGTLKIVLTSKVGCTPTLSIVGRGFEPYETKLLFVESNQIKVDFDRLSIEAINLPYRFKVNGITSSITVETDNPQLVATVDPVNREFVIVKAATPNFESDILGNITIKHAGHNDIVIPTRLNVTPNLEKPDMSINGKQSEVTVGTEFFVIVPMPDEDDVITATTSNPTDCTARILEDKPNRIYIKPAVVGSYTVTITHSSYKDAVITVVALPVAEEPIPEEKPKEPVYDLGHAPEVVIETNTENFVDDVLKSPEITTDEQRVAYIIVNGPAQYVNMGRRLVEEALALDPKNPTLTIQQGGERLFVVYSILSEATGIEDYYEFKEAVRFLTKIFKIYKDRGLSKISLNRYTSGWSKGETALEQYIKLVNFFTTFVEMNGTGVDVYSFDFSKSLTNKLIRFCNENIVP